MATPTGPIDDRAEAIAKLQPHDLDKKNGYQH